MDEYFKKYEFKYGEKITWDNDGVAGAGIINIDYGDYVKVGVGIGAINISKSIITSVELTDESMAMEREQDSAVSAVSKLASEPIEYESASTENPGIKRLERAIKSQGATDSRNFNPCMFGFYCGLKLALGLINDETVEFPEYPESREWDETHTDISWMKKIQLWAKTTSDWPNKEHLQKLNDLMGTGLDFQSASNKLEADASAEIVPWKESSATPEEIREQIRHMFKRITGRDMDDELKEQTIIRKGDLLCLDNNGLIVSGIPPKGEPHPNSDDKQADTDEPDIVPETPGDLMNEYIIENCHICKDDKYTRIEKQGNGFFVYCQIHLGNNNSAPTKESAINNWNIKQREPTETEDV